ncbi:hypothetical protein BJX66DRAFT_324199 [Aspergillus keveii]|uniref:Zn(2)-C6 fungal-type domain-containing protein n=1 Tax=Aspergillus keveii TaxID=714993 RepID=A0ABR4GB44_9EURO
MPQRANNTRSRAGCLTCRQRHIRCDEQRPTCQKCLDGNKSCNYAHAVIPLRDRRVLQKNALPPGQQAPWALVETPGLTVRRLPASAALDPFDSLPIKMPYKSRELYHYFYQTGAAFAVAPADANDDCIALTTLDEHALRSTILIAGIHYSWNTGTLRAYESSFLFHKIESIRIINTWLQASDCKAFVVCVRQILTICLAEACLGNIPAAEIHLNGVMALFDSREDADGVRGSSDDLETELADRYLILTSCFVLILKSRLEDFKFFLATQGLNSTQDASSAQALKLIKTWHGLEHGGLDTRLKAMRLFPYFFSPRPTNRRPRMIDAWPIINSLRTITETVDNARINPTPEQLQHVWNDGGPTRLLLDMVNAHVDSFARDDKNEKASNSSPPSTNDASSKQKPPIYSSWSGLSAAGELYIHSVLGLMDSGKPLKCRLLYRVLLILKRDVEQTRDELRGDGGTILQSLWFWKVFVGALALYRHFVSESKAIVCRCARELEELYRWFRGYARAWSAVTGRTHWDDVQCVLARMTWPNFLPLREEDEAGQAWARIALERVE